MFFGVTANRINPSMCKLYFQMDLYKCKLCFLYLDNDWIRMYITIHIPRPKCLLHVIVIFFEHGI